MRKWVGVLAFSAATLGATSALAQVQNFGKQGTIGLSADRLFGFYKVHLSAEDGNGDDFHDDATGFGFVWGPAGGGAYPFMIPRFAFDYFVIDNLNIGGSIGYFSWNDDDDNGGLPDGDYSAFEFAPRVGYWIGIGSVVGFWPRGGFTYHSLNVDGGGDSNGLALTLEAMFGIGPVEHFMFLVGPTVDFDFIGKRECNGPGPGPFDDDCKNHYRQFGISVGLMGWL